MRIRSKRMIAARAKGEHTKRQWLEMKRFFQTCVKCHGASGLINVERDHIIPVYQGGDDSIRNLQPLCAQCNAHKGPECIDHRMKFCISRGLIMPEKWSLHEK